MVVTVGGIVRPITTIEIQNTFEDNKLRLYRYAKKIYEMHNRKIFNATVGDKLVIFENVDLSHVFDTLV